MDTAFQANSYQNDAFQVASPIPADDDRGGEVDRRRSRREAEALAALIEQDDELHLLLD